MTENPFAKDQGGYFRAYCPEPAVAGNPFVAAPTSAVAPPAFEDVQHLLPRPFWDGHEGTIAAWNAAWELAFGNLRRPAPGSPFVASYLDAAFNGHVFMWDSVFMLLFGCYAQRVFPFHGTIDNLYARQHPDGFICREIDEAGGLEQFHRHDPSSTGPNVLAWFELSLYRHTGDHARLAQVFPALLGYHRWLRRYRTWQDGSYWTSGWGSGMDNQPRFGALPPEGWFHHGRMSWIDATAQALLSARSLLAIAGIIGTAAGRDELTDEADLLCRIINDTMWDDGEAWYADRHADGSLSPLKSVGSYWTLLAGAVPEDRLERFVAHLDDPRSFARPHPVPSLAADAPQYDPAGGYWLGSVWSPTNYMVLAGLESTGHFERARRIAQAHHDTVCSVHADTGTFWENYAPEHVGKGSFAADRFVGWTGLSVISVLVEYVMGIRADHGGEVSWRLGPPERHGMRDLPIGPDGLISLTAAAVTPGEPRAVQVECTVPVTLELTRGGAPERFALPAGSHSL